jgi:hypothetical protein
MLKRLLHIMKLTKRKTSCFLNRKTMKQEYKYQMSKKPYNIFYSDALYIFLGKGAQDFEARCSRTKPIGVFHKKTSFLQIDLCYWRIFCFVLRMQKLYCDITFLCLCFGLIESEENFKLPKVDSKLH